MFDSHIQNSWGNALYQLLKGCRTPRTYAELMLNLLTTLRSSENVAELLSYDLMTYISNIRCQVHWHQYT